MKVTYDPEADVLCFLLRDEAPTDAVEESNGMLVSYGDDGEPVSVEFLNAAARNLTTDEELSVTVQATMRRPPAPDAGT